MTVCLIKREFKIRMFYDNMLNQNGLLGRIDIKKGTKEFILEELKKNLNNLRKVIIEVI